MGRASPVRSLALGVGVFLLCLAGIVSRPHFDLATFWPANAFMLGMIVRFPDLDRAVTWFSGAAGFVLADAVTGSELIPNLVLNGGNLAAIATGYRLLVSLPWVDRTLSRPGSILYFLRAVLAASFVAGLIGIGANPLLFQGPWTEGFAFWSATEMANYVAFLPVFLTLPSLKGRRFSWSGFSLAGISPMRAMPLLALLASAGAGVLIGGPGAVAFPVPALLWCALTYSVFSTACLAFAFGAWTLLSIRIGILPVGTDLASRPMLLSARVGVSLVALAPLVVASVMAARNELLARLQFLADRDAMTGLLNRRAFLEAGNTTLEASIGNGRPTAVMMLDIDHFKAINDRYGHEAGDHVLCAFAVVLAENLRPQDEVGRIGGEEFAVVLPDCSPENAKLVAQRINEALHAKEMVLGHGIKLRVTVSIGVHVEGGEGEGYRLDRLLAWADKALYQAKDAGRDRVEFSNRLPSEGGADMNAATG